MLMGYSNRYVSSTTQRAINIWDKKKNITALFSKQNEYFISTYFLSHFLLLISIFLAYECISISAKYTIYNIEYLEKTG